jgi:hypothetical protein
MAHNQCGVACTDCLCHGCTLDCSVCDLPRCFLKSIRELCACGCAAHLYDVLDLAHDRPDRVLRARPSS